MSTNTGSTGQHSNFWALLVGTNKYEAVPNLRGCVNDVRAMHDFLVRNLMVPKQHIRSLTTDNPGALPTRHRIINTFQDFLINNPHIQYGDQILFHFSGHGSQIRDTTGLEPDGYSETLVAMDSRHDGVWDIPDKTLAALLDQLIEKKGENITVILDCCHAGSGTRNIAGPGLALVRRVEPDPRLPPPDLDADILAKSSHRAATPGGWPHQHIPYTLLAACLDREQASEHLVVDAETNAHSWHGALTYFTLDAMRRMQSGTSYAQLAEQIAVKVNSQYSHQTPQCEGQRDREVFGYGWVERDPLILVKYLQDQITIDAGLIHQIHPGDKLALYPHEVQTKADLPRQPLATIEVTSVSPTTAHAKITEGSQRLPTLTRGLVTEVAYTGHRQTVVLQAAETDIEGKPLPKTQVRANRTAIERLSQYLKTADSPYLTVVDKHNQPAQLRVVAQNGRYGIYNTQGELLISPEKFEGGNDATAVVSTLENIARYRAILALLNREAGSQLVGNLEVVLRHLVGDEARDLTDVAVNDEYGLTLYYDPDCQENNYYGVDVTNHASVAVYPHVLILNPDYSIYLLYPAIGEQNAIAPNHALSIGLDRGQHPLEIYLPEGCDSSRDCLKVFGTTKPADFSVLQQKGLNTAPRRNAPTRALTSPLDRLLETATFGGNTRVSRPAQTLAGEDWATVELSYTVASSSDRKFR